MLSWTTDNAALLSSADPKPKSKHSSLPVLVVLFLISYGLMSMLVVEQARTIENQRALIQSLFYDSTQLNHLKSLDRQRAAAQAQAEAKSHSQAQTPSTQDKTRDHAKNSVKPRKQVPPTPPTDAVDRTDERRSLVSI